MLRVGCYGVSVGAGAREERGWVRPMPKPSEPKPCPFCGQGPFAETYNEWSMGVVSRVTWVQCATEDCPLHKLDWIRAEQWNSRPVEDALVRRINDLENALRATATEKR